VNQRRYASLKEVAARAGVSFQTASKFLNGGPVRVSTQTAEQITAAARELHYFPNSVARSLVQRATSTIGIVTGDLTDLALSEFVVGAERSARRSDHAVLVGNLALGGEDGFEVVSMLIERRVDGIIAAAPQLEEDTAVSELLRNYVPTVSLHHVPGGGIPLIGSDHHSAARLATEHLIHLGHQWVGCVTGPFRRRVVRSRLRGYEEALRSASCSTSEDLVVEADWTPGGAAMATRLLVEREPRVTAIFVHSDVMSIGVYSALSAMGRRVPEDMAVVSCDDLLFAPYMTPALSSVHIPFAETGELAVELLLKRIRGDEVPPEPSLLPVQLAVRASCGSGALPASTQQPSHPPLLSEVQP
jgi:LacI family transcriptional regulator